MDRGVCWATVHGVKKIQTKLSDYTIATWVNDVELLFMYLLGICMSSLEKNIYSALIPVFSWIVCEIFLFVFMFLLLSCMNSLYIVLLDISPFTSVTQSCLTLCNPMDCSTEGFPVHHQLLEFGQTHVHRVSDAIQPSNHLIPFSSCLQSFPASGSFPVNQFFASDSQSIGASASAPVLPVNIQDWFPLGLTGLILQSKGLSLVFFNTIVQKHQWLVPYQIHNLQIFPFILWSLFSCLVVSFAVQKHFTLMYSHSFIFALILLHLMKIQKIITNTYVKKFTTYLFF